MNGYECNGHGTCSGASDYVCDCDDGYFGADCTLRKCPEGLAWWDEPTATDTAHALAQCSNRVRIFCPNFVFQVFLSLYLYVKRGYS